MDARSASSSSSPRRPAGHGPKFAASICHGRPQVKLRHPAVFLRHRSSRKLLPPPSSLEARPPPTPRSGRLTPFSPAGPSPPASSSPPPFKPSRRSPSPRRLPCFALVCRRASASFCRDEERLPRSPVDQMEPPPGGLHRPAGPVPPLQPIGPWPMFPLRCEDSFDYNDLTTSWTRSSS